MSKRETPLTLRFWEDVGGELYEEFQVVKSSPSNGRRLIDGLIVLNRKKKRVEDRRKHRDLILKNEDVIVVQTKASRLGMYLLGQAFFSRELAKKFKPKSIRTVAICTKSDSVLEPFCQKWNIDVITFPQL